MCLSLRAEFSGRQAKIMCELAFVRRSKLSNKPSNELSKVYPNFTSVKIQYSNTTNIAIVGVGLIGGSAAIRLRETQQYDRIIGVDKSEANRKKALQLHLVDDFLT